MSADITTLSEATVRWSNSYWAYITTWRTGPAMDISRLFLCCGFALAFFVRLRARMHFHEYDSRVPLPHQYLPSVRNVPSAI